MAIFEGKKSANDIIINHRMSDDEVFAFYVSPGYLFLLAHPLCPGDSFFFQKRTRKEKKISRPIFEREFGRSHEATIGFSLHLQNSEAQDIFFLARKQLLAKSL